MLLIVHDTDLDQEFPIRDLQTHVTHDAYFSGHQSSLQQLNYSILNIFF